MHLVLTPRVNEVDEISTLCGGLLCVEEMEAANPGDCVTCSECFVRATTPCVATESVKYGRGADIEFLSGATTWSLLGRGLVPYYPGQLAFIRSTTP